MRNKTAVAIVAASAAATLLVILAKRAGASELPGGAFGYVRNYTTGEVIPISNALVELRVGAGGTGEVVATTNTDSQGFFTIKGIPAGIYSVWVWRNNHQAAKGVTIGDTMVNVNVDVSYGFTV